MLHGLLQILHDALLANHLEDLCLRFLVKRIIVEPLVFALALEPGGALRLGRGRVPHRPQLRVVDGVGQVGAQVAQLRETLRVGEHV